jgi:alanyl-tRNA synthetase
LENQIGWVLLDKTPFYATSGGHNFKEGKSVGIHLEPGPDGGLVMIDDTTVLERALKILDEMAGKTEEAVRA